MATFAINEAVAEYRENDALLIAADNTDVRQPAPACGLTRLPASRLSIPGSACPLRRSFRPLQSASG